MGVNRTANFLWAFCETPAQPAWKPPRCVHRAIAQIDAGCMHGLYLEGLFPGESTEGDPYPEK